MRRKRLGMLSAPLCNLHKKAGQNSTAKRRGNRRKNSSGWEKFRPLLSNSFCSVSRMGQRLGQEKADKIRLNFFGAIQKKKS